MISYEKALEILLNNEKLTSKTIAINQSLNHICAKDTYCNSFVPPFANSAMDGFAIKNSDIANASKENPIKLKIMGSTVAGDKPSKGIKGAWEIMTGAPVPQNYDAVVKIEDISVSDGFATFFKPVEIRNNIRDAGEDFKPNELVIKSGTNISSSHIMALATIGQSNILVANKPKITIFSTGKEIIDDANIELLAGQIRNSNSPYLISALNEMNLSPTYGGTIFDDPDIFEDKINQALKSNDIIISTGAVSMGKHDFIPDSLRNLGAKILFHKVYIRPGKPILYAQFPNGTHYFGLPGNPISAAVGLRFFVVPLLNHLQGLAPEQAIKAKLLTPLSKKKPFRFFCKAFASVTNQGQLELKILKGQQSFKIHPLLEANCWASFAPDKAEFDLGELIDIYPLTTNKFNLEN